jgi:hypothetical protein
MAGGPPPAVTYGPRRRVDTHPPTRPLYRSSMTAPKNSHRYRQDPYVALSRSVEVVFVGHVVLLCLSFLWNCLRLSASSSSGRRDGLFWLSSPGTHRGWQQTLCRDRPDRWVGEPRFVTDTPSSQVGLVIEWLAGSAWRSPRAEELSGI